MHVDDFGWYVSCNQQGQDSKPKQDCQQTNVTPGQILYCKPNYIPIKFLYQMDIPADTHVLEPPKYLRIHHEHHLEHPAHQLITTRHSGEVKGRSVK